ncbi:MAG: rod shape-determining protein RodA [Clostridia bacterium]|nr:rod shape-determining protein RodA [Clostridia bacterium]
MFDRRLIKNIDFGLIGIVILIFVIGLIIITSATNVIDLSKGISFNEAIKDILKNGIEREPKVQVVAFVIGIVGVIATLCIDYNTFGEAYKIIYVVSIILLLLVYVPGLAVDSSLRGGARSWISLGVIDLQTSEIAKLGFILSFAKYIEGKYEKLESFKDLIGPILFILPFLILLLKQPDLGSALVFVIIAFGMIFIAGINMKMVIFSILIGLSSMPLVYNFLKDHQKNRIDAFLDPSHPSNYQVQQSKTAIGSGMVYGKGIFRGTFHRGDFLPVQETDFIYAVLGEELGLIGCSIVLLLYFALLYKMVNIAKESKDVYGLLIVTGVTFMFAFQIIENIGMTMGIMPVTGVTLPFLSYGGSSLITSMIALGLVLNVSMRKKKIRF